MQTVEINKIPSLTWNWLKMNQAKVELPDELQYAEPAEAPLETSHNKEIISSSQTINLSLEDKTNNVSNYEIVANEGENLDVVILSSSPKDAEGFQILNTKILAKKDSTVHLTKVQLLGKNYTQICNTQFLAEDNAKVEVNHIILGAKKTFFEVKGDLTGDKSNFKSNAAYICKEKQELDINYVINQFGKKTDSDMYVLGTLYNGAKKTYRGTIDFKNGCKDATGNEQEEVLLLGENVVNNSIPVILCDEEDVAGEHGATIGRLGEDTLFYMQSRGIPKNTAENLIARAKIQRVLETMTDEQSKNAIYSFMNEVSFDKTSTKIIWEFENE